MTPRKQTIETVLATSARSGVTERAGTDVPVHGFLNDGKRWTIERHAFPPFKQTGLHFSQGTTTRFLGFSRGALPTDRELSSMTDEVLRVLLQRAERVPPVGTPRGIHA